MRLIDETKLLDDIYKLSIDDEVKTKVINEILKQPVHEVQDNQKK